MTDASSPRKRRVSPNAETRELESAPPRASWESHSMVAPRLTGLEVAVMLYNHIAASEEGDDDPARAKRIFEAMRVLRERSDTSGAARWTSV